MKYKQKLPVQQWQGKPAEVDETTEDEVIVEDVETEEVEDETTEDEVDEGSDEESSETEDSDDDEVVVTIGDSPAPEEEEAEKAPTWVRDLRKAHRETQRENRELKQKLEAMNNPTPKKVELGPKPKLEDYDYDTEKYDQELQTWYDTKRAADEEAKAVEAEQKAQQEAWQARLAAYGDNRAKLKVKDFDEAESTVQELFDQTQQGIIIQGADNSALVFYALGKNPDRLKELSNIKDPVKFAFAVAKLEKDLKVGKRKAPPPPEKTVNGTAPKSGSVDSTLERLRAEAEKTGNYTKVHQYKRQKRQAKG